MQVVDNTKEQVLSGMGYPALYLFIPNVDSFIIARYNLVHIPYWWDDKPESLAATVSLPQSV